MNWLNKYIFIFLFLAGFATSQGQIVKTELVLNPLDSHEVQSSFDIGFLFHMQNGEARMTMGFLEGLVSWDEIEVSSSSAVIHDGWISFSRYQMHQHNYKIDITVESSKHGLLLQDTFVVPHFASFQIKNDRPYLLPGEDLRLEIESVFSNGSLYSSERDNMLAPQDFDYFVNGVPIDLDMYYVKYGEKKVELKAVYRTDPKIYSDIILPVKYPEVFNLNFTGEDGLDAENGKNGIFQPRRYEYLNMHGSNGYHGQDGQDGSNINMVFRAVPSRSDTLLQVLLVTDTTYRYLEMRAGQNELILNLNGGDGGRGGNGGKGVDAFEIPGRARVLSGSGGNGGYGGDGGQGGESFLFTDSFGQYFVEHFKVLNLGGKAGLGGFYGEAGKPLAHDSTEKKKRTVARLITIGEVEGVDGRMGQRGKPGEDGPPPVLELITVEELDWLFERYGG